MSDSKKDNETTVITNNDIKRIGRIAFILIMVFIALIILNKFGYI